MTDIHHGPHTFDPVREWLLANGVDLNRTPSWPDILFGDDTFRIQQLTYRQDGEFKQTALVKLGGHIGLPLRWIEMPIVEPIDPDLQTDYPRMRAEVARSVLVEELGRAGVNVVSVGAGDSLVFVFSSMSDGLIEDAMDLLRKALPGVNPVIVSGCEAVIKAKGVTQ